MRQWRSRLRGHGIMMMMNDRRSRLLHDQAPHLTCYHHIRDRKKTVVIITPRRTAHAAAPSCNELLRRSIVRRSARGRLWSSSVVVLVRTRLHELTNNPFNRCRLIVRSSSGGGA